MSLQQSALEVWESLYIPDSEGTTGSEMEADLGPYSKPETVVPTSDIYEVEVYFSLKRLYI